MSKKKSRKFSPNSVQINVLRTLQIGGFLERNECNDFCLFNTNNESIPINNTDYPDIWKLINRGYIKANKEITRKVPAISGKELLKSKFIIYAITSKGIVRLSQVEYEVEVRLRI